MMVYKLAAKLNMFCSAASIGKYSKDVALTVMLGKMGPTTSPTSEILALLLP